MAPTAAQRLADYQRRYRELADQLADIGFIAAGSITHRHTRCANLNCRCHAGHPHGPYWQWTAKVNGKTVTKRLTEAQAQHYQRWIANDRQLRALISQMRRTADQATTLILKHSELDPDPEV